MACISFDTKKASGNSYCKGVKKYLLLDFSWHMLISASDINSLKELLLLEKSVLIAQL
jgi:hypothetical protein